jgi:hypothetical protein
MLQEEEVLLTLPLMEKLTLLAMASWTLCTETMGLTEQLEGL